MLSQGNGAARLMGTVMIETDEQKEVFELIQAEDRPADLLRGMDEDVHVDGDACGEGS